MGLSRTEVNLRRLIAAASSQQCQAKLVHYVATLLEQLAEERSSECLPRVSKSQLNEYSKKIEAIASKLVATEEPTTRTKVEESPSTSEAYSIQASKGLRKRNLPLLGDASQSTVDDSNSSTAVKLDAVAHVHIEKHRKLQEDLTDEMVGLARQLKESSLMKANPSETPRRYSTQLRKRLNTA